MLSRIILWLICPFTDVKYYVCVLFKLFEKYEKPKGGVIRLMSLPVARTFPDIFHVKRTEHISPENNSPCVPLYDSKEVLDCISIERPVLLRYPRRSVNKDICLFIQNHCYQLEVFFASPNKMRFITWWCPGESPELSLWQRLAILRPNLDINK